MYLKLMDIDELFDFSGDRDDIFSSTTADIFHNLTTSTASGTEFQYSFNNPTTTTDFTDHFCLPSDDVAELEWLSKFVDDSVSNFPENNIAGTINFRPENSSSHNKSRSKRTRAPSKNQKWNTSSPVPTIPICESSSSGDTTAENGGVVRRCTHCLSEKTPQWRTGPLGPKTLCNACGVRFKSGRLVPEYRPAASPTFVLTQHSNSHRKVMELRRQKEVTSVHHHQYHHQQQVVSSEHQIYGGGNHHHHRQQKQLHHGSNYEIC